MSTTGSVSQDFNTLISSGTDTWADNSTISNWYAQRTKSGNSIAADAGGANAGNLYSYGSNSSTDRSLGSLGSNSAGSFAYGVQLKNTSSAVITSIKISYTLEQWRNSGTAAQTVSFYYKISSNLITSLDPNSNGTWTNVAALNSISPKTGGSAAALDGNASAN